MKFNTLQAARGFKNRAVKAMAIIMGCDGLYWVVTLREMEKLIAQGYEVFHD